MLVIKSQPVGVDIPVEKYAKFLYDQLKALWNLSDEQFEAYGRCYRDMVDKGYMPRFFVASDSARKSQYADIHFDDQRTSALFFFDIDDVTRYQPGSKVKAYLIFVVNISKIKTATAHRGDEEIRNDVLRLCNSSRYGFDLVESVTGYKNVFSRFDALLGSDQVSLRDFHPVHVFKVCFDLLYDFNAC